MEYPAIFAILHLCSNAVRGEAEIMRVTKAGLKRLESEFNGYLEEKGWTGFVRSSESGSPPALAAGVLPTVSRRAGTIPLSMAAPLPN